MHSPDTPNSPSRSLPLVDTDATAASALPQPAVPFADGARPPLPNAEVPQRPVLAADLPQLPGESSVPSDPTSAAGLDEPNEPPGGVGAGEPPSGPDEADFSPSDPDEPIRRAIPMVIPGGGYVSELVLRYQHGDLLDEDLPAVAEQWRELRAPINERLLRIEPTAATEPGPTELSDARRAAVGLGNAQPSDTQSAVTEPDNEGESSQSGGISDDPQNQSSDIASSPEQEVSDEQVHHYVSTLDDALRVADPDEVQNSATRISNALAAATSSEDVPAVLNYLHELPEERRAEVAADVARLFDRVLVLAAGEITLASADYPNDSAQQARLGVAARRFSELSAQGAALVESVVEQAMAEDGLALARLRERLNNLGQAGQAVVMALEPGADPRQLANSMKGLLAHTKELYNGDNGVAAPTPVGEPEENALTGTPVDVTLATAPLPNVARRREAQLEWTNIPELLDTPQQLGPEAAPRPIDEPILGPSREELGASVVLASLRRPPVHDDGSVPFMVNGPHIAPTVAISTVRLRRYGSPEEAVRDLLPQVRMQIHHYEENELGAHGLWTGGSSTDSQHDSLALPVWYDDRDGQTHTVPADDAMVGAYQELLPELRDIESNLRRLANEGATADELAAVQRQLAEFGVRNNQVMIAAAPQATPEQKMKVGEQAIELLSPHPGQDPVTADDLDQVGEALRLRYEGNVEKISRTLTNAATMVNQPLATPGRREQQHELVRMSAKLTANTARMAGVQAQELIADVEGTLAKHPEAAPLHGTLRVAANLYKHADEWSVRRPGPVDPEEEQARYLEGINTARQMADQLLESNPYERSMRTEPDEAALAIVVPGELSQEERSQYPPRIGMPYVPSATPPVATVELPFMETITATEEHPVRDAGQFFSAESVVRPAPEDDDQVVAGHFAAKVNLDGAPESIIDTVAEQLASYQQHIARARQRQSSRFESRRRRSTQQQSAEEFQDTLAAQSAEAEAQVRGLAPTRANALRAVEALVDVQESALQIGMEGAGANALVDILKTQFETAYSHFNRQPPRGSDVPSSQRATDAASVANTSLRTTARFLDRLEAELRAVEAAMNDDDLVPPQAVAHLDESMRVVSQAVSCYALDLNPNRDTAHEFDRSRVLLGQHDAYDLIPQPTPGLLDRTSVRWYLRHVREARTHFPVQPLGVVGVREIARNYLGGGDDSGINASGTNPTGGPPSDPSSGPGMPRRPVPGSSGHPGGRHERNPRI
ncbi:MAG: hypothetical protein HOQ05_11145 [Corynebacteriales bacterium]|nr:hypothetical protein [Mycobacteriales bacterium]